MRPSVASPFVPGGRQPPSCDEVPTPSFLLPSRSHRRQAASDNHVSIQDLWQHPGAGAYPYPQLLMNQQITQHPLPSQGTQNRLANTGVVPPSLPSLFVGGVPATTVLLRNVKRRLSQEDAMRLIPRGFWQYDLFYLLFDLPRNRGSGRIFINFETHDDAITFRNAFHGVQHPGLSAVDEEGGLRPLMIEPSRHQGVYQNIANYRRTLRQRVHTCMFPAIFISGNRINFSAIAMHGASSSSSSRP